MSAAATQSLAASQGSARIERLVGVSPQERPILAVANGEIISAVDTAPTLLSGTNRWRGFTMEVLDTPASETPPRTSLVRHLVCSVDSCAPFRFYWQENGRERSKLVGAGDHLIRSQQEIVGFRWDNAARVFILGVDPETMETLMRDVVSPRGVQLQEFYGVPDDYLHSLMGALASDLAHDSPTGPILGESLCTAIAVHTTRNYAVYGLNERRWNMPLGDHRLRLVLDFIESRLSDELSLFELAEVAGISPFYLTRMFKARLNLSVHQYVLEQRVERAKRFLSRTDLDLSAIARAIGFRHQSHFSQVFRARVGISPFQFRQAS